MTQKREIELNDILDLISCAEDYGHGNQVCMVSLCTWASPVTQADIDLFAASIEAQEGCSREDGDLARETLEDAFERFGPKP